MCELYIILKVFEKILGNGTVGVLCSATNNNKRVVSATETTL